MPLAHDWFNSNHDIKIANDWLNFEMFQSWLVQQSLKFIRFFASDGNKMNFEQIVRLTHGIEKPTHSPVSPTAQNLIVG